MPSSTSIIAPDASAPPAIAAAAANDVAALAALDPSEFAKSDHHGSTCLHWAAGQGSVEAVRFLVEGAPRMDPAVHEAKKKGARGRSGQSGRSPLHFAARNGHLEVVRYLCELSDRDRGRDGDRDFVGVGDGDVCHDGDNKDEHQHLCHRPGPWWACRLRCAGGDQRSTSQTMML